MRLAQFSRRAGVKSEDVLKFLSTHGIHVEDNANSRIPDEGLTLALTHFAPHLKTEKVVEPEILPESKTISTDEEPVQDPLPPAPEILPIPQPEASIAMDPGESQPSPEEQATPVELESAVIKAPKIELQGLKVLGKIELPEPKKKEAPAPVSPESGEPVQEPSQPRRKDRTQQSQNGRRTVQNRPKKNPIALQREREEREAAERKKEELKREKEKRTQYYLERVKHAAPPKRVSLVDEPLSRMEDEAPDKPKSIWGRFVKWLTSH